MLCSSEPDVQIDERDSLRYLDFDQFGLLTRTRGFVVGKHNHLERTSRMPSRVPRNSKCSVPVSQTSRSTNGTPFGTSISTNSDFSPARAGLLSANTTTLNALPGCLLVCPGTRNALFQ